MNTDGKKINFNSVPLQGLEIDSNLNFDKHISKHGVRNVRFSGKFYVRTK